MPINGVRPLGLLPVPGQGVTRPMFRTLAISASGLSAQRQRIETIAQNLANADVPLNADGTGGYKPRTLMMETANATNAQFSSTVPPGIGGTIAGASGSAMSSDSRQSITVPFLSDAGRGDGQPYGVAVTGVVETQGEGRKLYEPSHPNADADGYVHYPDVNTTQEMVSMLDAKRIYEANASVFQAAKSMLRASLDI
ncbi:MAG: flagellar basal body rod protein FlgC [Gemmatimonadaceae bacterium]